MSLQVYTSRYRYRGADRLDITRTSAREEHKIFAPSNLILWPMIKARSEYLGREGEIDRSEEMWPGYVVAYTAEMRVSYRDYREQWDEVLQRDRVTLVCFCADAERCHRGLLAGILEKLGAMRMGEVPL